MIGRLRRQLAAGAGRDAVPAGGAGHPRRRPRQRRTISIHAAGRRSLEELYEWAPKIAAALQNEPELTDVNCDQQNKGLETDLVIDRDAAARLGVTVSQIDNTLYDAFGQRQVSTIYVARNQYHVVMEVAPQYWQNPETLKDVYVSTSGGAVGGSQATNAVAGTVVAKSTAAAAAAANAQAARNQATNSIGATGKGAASTGAAVSTRRRDDDAAVGGRQFGRAQRRSRSITRACSSPTRSRSTSRQAFRLSEADRDHRGHHEPARRAGDHPRHFPGHGAGVSGVARQPAVPDSRGA